MSKRSAMPRKPGWYWAIYHCDSLLPIEVVFVDAGSVYRVGTFSYSRLQFKTYFQNTEFIGPIKPPTTKKKGKAK